MTQDIRYICISEVLRHSCDIDNYDAWEWEGAEIMNFDTSEDMAAWIAKQKEAAAHSKDEGNPDEYWCFEVVYQGQYLPVNEES